MIFIPILIFICCGWCGCWTSICMAGRADEEGMDGEDEGAGLFGAEDDHDLESGGGMPSPSMPGPAPPGPAPPAVFNVPLSEDAVALK